MNEKENILNKKFYKYVEKQTEKDDYRMLDDDAYILNRIRKATIKTANYMVNYKIYSSAGVPTTGLTNKWIDDAKDSAENMYEFDSNTQREVNYKIFNVENNFETNMNTQEQFADNIISLQKLYEMRLEEFTKDKTKEEKEKYMKSVEADKDFLYTYFQDQFKRMREKDYPTIDDIINDAKEKKAEHDRNTPKPNKKKDDPSIE